MNIELASPLDFIPVPPGWEDRSPPIARIGRVSSLAYFEQIEPDLYRYPALDPPSFRRAVEEAARAAG